MLTKPVHSDLGGKEFERKRAGDSGETAGILPLRRPRSAGALILSHYSIHQLAKPTFHSRYAHTPFGSAPLPILLS